MLPVASLVVVVAAVVVDVVAAGSMTKIAETIAFADEVVESAEPVVAAEQ